MKITPEALTVLPNVARGEVNIILGGIHITLTAEESLLLAAGLADSLDQLQGREPRDAAAAETWDVARSTPADPDLRSSSSGKETASSPEMLVRTRALIQASMREKGLSLRETERE
jgi:hypothetical protein